MLFQSTLTLALAAVASAKRSQLTFGDASPSWISSSDLVSDISLPAYEWITAHGLRPCPKKSLSLAQLQKVAVDTFGEEAVWNCVGNVLSSVWWSGEAGHTVSTCPKTGIKWLPLSYKTQTTKASPPTGAIIINVVNATTGVQTGCLGDKGMWSLGACGVFNVTSYNETVVDTPATLASFLVPNNFTLSTIAGNCSAAKGVFSCKNLTVPSFFQSNASESLISFNASTAFFSPFAPMGPWMKMPILTKAKLSTVNVSLSYTAAPAPPL
ncbi:hypothetical protein T439DRAFT_326871 [Meredithblackwellia eburnea MCA 4105]